MSEQDLFAAMILAASYWQICELLKRLEADAVFRSRPAGENMIGVLRRHRDQKAEAV